MNDFLNFVQFLKFPWFHKVLAVVKPGLAGPSVECKQVTTGIIEDWWGPAHDVGGPAHDDGDGLVAMMTGLAG
jgi:hypothetical protein